MPDLNIHDAKMLLIEQARRTGSIEEMEELINMVGHIRMVSGACELAKLSITLLEENENAQGFDVTFSCDGENWFSGIQNGFIRRDTGAHTITPASDDELQHLYDRFEDVGFNIGDDLAKLMDPLGKGREFRFGVNREALAIHMTPGNAPIDYLEVFQSIAPAAYQALMAEINPPQNTARPIDRG